MELRVLQYFLAVAREQSISGASEYLHLSQPTLSRQLKDLEDELGKQLFWRGSRKITLTEEGMLLRKRAEQILDLVQKTENEISLSDDMAAGDIYIGAAETESIRLVAKAAHRLQQRHPQIHFHISSGDACDVLDRLDRGLIDFGVLFDLNDLSRFQHLQLPGANTWGALMRRDAPLAKKESLTPQDLTDKPLILSRQQKDGSPLLLWLQRTLDELNIAATYSLLYNASILVEEGMGYALGLDRVVNTACNSQLCFRPFSPKLAISVNVVWKKYQVLTRAAEKFLAELRAVAEEASEEG